MHNIFTCFSSSNKMKNKAKITTLSQTVLISYRKSQKQKPLHTHIYDRSISCIDTGTSINSGGVKLIFWTQSSPLSKMMLSCKGLCMLVKCQHGNTRIYLGDQGCCWNNFHQKSKYEGGGNSFFCYFSYLMFLGGIVMESSLQHFDYLLTEKSKTYLNVRFQTSAPSILLSLIDFCMKTQISNTVKTCLNRTPLGLKYLFSLNRCLAQTDSNYIDIQQMGL